MLDILEWSYVIRFRGGILVAHDGVQKPASEWLAPNGRARRLDGASVTADKSPVGAVVTVRAKSMNKPWFLATNLEDTMATEVVKLYDRRFTIEETFRDEKDLRFGMGHRAAHTRNAERRDRLLMRLAIAIAFHTLIGAALGAHGHGCVAAGEYRQATDALALSPGLALVSLFANDGATSGSRS